MHRKTKRNKSKVSVLQVKRICSLCSRNDILFAVVYFCLETRCVQIIKVEIKLIFNPVLFWTI